MGSLILKEVALVKCKGNYFLDKGTWGQGDKGTRRQGDKETRGQGELNGGRNVPKEQDEFSPGHRPGNGNGTMEETFRRNRMNSAPDIVRGMGMAQRKNRSEGTG